MSTWAAFAVKGVAVTGTDLAGADFTRPLTPGVLYGFAAGMVLSGMCFLVLVALRRARLAAWPRPDYYALPADTHSAAGEPADLAAPADHTWLADPVAPAESAVSAEQADPAPPAREVTEPQLPLEFGDPVLEPLPPAPSSYLSGSYEPSPYEPSMYAPSPFAPNPFAEDPFAEDPFAEDPDAPDPYAAAAAFGSDGDLDYDSHRGYHSKHRMTALETNDRRSEARRMPPRHAAHSSRRSSRPAASNQLVPARG